MKNIFAALVIMLASINLAVAQNGIFIEQIGNSATIDLEQT